MDLGLRDTETFPKITLAAKNKKKGRGGEAQVGSMYFNRKGVRLGRGLRGSKG